MITVVESRKNGEILFTFIGKIVPDSCESRRENLGVHYFCFTRRIREDALHPLVIRIVHSRARILLCT